jgi:hypothetical protein
MAEGNSCYRGGKPGMSDAFASALWCADYMLMTAQAGYAGVNLHGGGTRQIRAALGQHLPGETVVKKPGAARTGSFYTPIAGGLDEGFSARPIFYGMMFANQFAGAQSVAVDFDPKSVNATAYAAKTDADIRVAIVNKDAARDLRVVLYPGFRTPIARGWRLSAPALEATEGIALAGRLIGPDGSWSPQEEVLQADARGRLTLDVGRASGALVFLSEL